MKGSVSQNTLVSKRLGIFRTHVMKKLMHDDYCNRLNHRKNHSKGMKFLCLYIWAKSLTKLLYLVSLWFLSHWPGERSTQHVERYGLRLWYEATKIVAVQNAGCPFALPPPPRLRQRNPVKGRTFLDIIFSETNWYSHTRSYNRFPLFEELRWAIKSSSEIIQKRHSGTPGRNEVKHHTWDQVKKDWRHAFPALMSCVPIPCKLRKAPTPAYLHWEDQKILLYRLTSKDPAGFSLIKELVSEFNFHHETWLSNIIHHIEERYSLAWSPSNRRVCKGWMERSNQSIGLMLGSHYPKFPAIHKWEPLLRNVLSFSVTSRANCYQ